MQVLTTGSWPTQTAAKCNLPRELEQCCKSFQDYYLKAHSGRKLSWQTNMGNADLKARALQWARSQTHSSTARTILWPGNCVVVDAVPSVPLQNSTRTSSCGA